MLTGNVYDPNTDIPDLSGKVYLVTGGTAGIGFGISAHLLQHNCSHLYLLAKKEEHADEAIEGLKKYGDTSRVSFVQCDLADLHQTDATATDLAKRLDRLDGLILNAGLGVGAHSITKDGIETHFQVNVVSQYRIALRLLPKLIATPNSRLCFQSSDLHRLGTSDVHFASLDEVNRDIGGNGLYAQTKLALICLARALVRRKERGELGLRKGEAPWINATHPGGVATDQNWQAEEAYGMLATAALTVLRPFMKDPVDQGCRPMLFAATSPAIVEEKLDGVYIVPDRKVTDPSSQAQDEELQERLWKLLNDILESKLGPLDG